MPADTAVCGGDPARDPVQSVSRALEILDVLHRQEIATIAELAAMQGVHRATTLRLLQTLERGGYVSRGEHRGEFKLGIKLFELGHAFADRSDLLRAARPMMRHLAQKTGETIDLGLCQNHETLLLESIALRPGARVGSTVGRRHAATCTTTGKIHLSMLPRTEVIRILSRQGLPKLGPKSITDPRSFLAELAKVRENGYALNDEETDANVRFVGVPIRLPGGASTSSLILGAPAERLTNASIPQVVRILQEAAACISDVA
jgi:DNA-binding IclR family transcriptional regulator